MSTRFSYNGLSLGVPEIPSEVIEGYYNKEDGKFYNEPDFVNEITGKSGIVYIDKGENYVYRYAGAFIAVSSAEGGMVNATAVENLEKVHLLSNGYYLNLEDFGTYLVKDRVAKKIDTKIGVCEIGYSLYSANQATLAEMETLFVITNAPASADPESSHGYGVFEEEIEHPSNNGCILIEGLYNTDATKTIIIERTAFGRYDGAGVIKIHPNIGIFQGQNRQQGTQAYRSVEVLSDNFTSGKPFHVWGMTYSAIGYVKDDKVYFFISTGSKTRIKITAEDGDVSGITAINTTMPTVSNAKDLITLYSTSLSQSSLQKTFTRITDLEFTTGLDDLFTVQLWEKNPYDTFFLIHVVQYTNREFYDEDGTDNIPEFYVKPFGSGNFTAVNIGDTPIDFMNSLKKLNGEYWLKFTNYGWGAPENGSPDGGATPVLFQNGRFYCWTSSGDGAYSPCYILFQDYNAEAEASLVLAYT